MTGMDDILKALDVDLSLGTKGTLESPNIDKILLEGNLAPLISPDVIETGGEQVSNITIGPEMVVIALKATITKFKNTEWDSWAQMYQDIVNQSQVNANVRLPLKLTRHNLIQYLNYPTVSRYGLTNAENPRFHLNATRSYRGIGIAMEIGTPLYAVKEGAVIEIDSNEEWGQYVIVEHEIYYNEIIYTLYTHLQKKSVLVETEEQVNTGTKIADSGHSSDHAFGPGLNWAISKKPEFDEELNDVIEPLMFNWRSVET